MRARLHRCCLCPVLRAAAFVNRSRFAGALTGRRRLKSRTGNLCLQAEECHQAEIRVKLYRREGGALVLDRVFTALEDQIDLVAGVSLRLAEIYDDTEIGSSAKSI